MQKPDDQHWNQENIKNKTKYNFSAISSLSKGKK